MRNDNFLHVNAENVLMKGMVVERGVVNSDAYKLFFIVDPCKLFSAIVGLSEVILGDRYLFAKLKYKQSLWQN